MLERYDGELFYRFFMEWRKRIHYPFFSQKMHDFFSQLTWIFYVYASANGSGCSGFDVLYYD